MARRKRTPEPDDDEQREIEEAIARAESGEPIPEPSALDEAIAAAMAEDPDECLTFADRGEQECRLHPGFAWPHQIAGDGDMTYCPGPGLDWPEDDRDTCLRCGMNRWMHDAEHLAFLSSKPNAFCTCGASASLHYRGGVVDGRFEQSPGVPFECQGFRDSTAVDPPEQKPLWRWEMAMHDGRAVMQHDIVFAGFTLTLDETRPEHKALWDQIRIGNVMSFDLTGDVVRTGQHKPIKADGEIIGLVEQRTIHLYAMPVAFAGGETAGLPLFESAAPTMEDLRDSLLFYAPTDLCVCGEMFSEHIAVEPWTCTHMSDLLMGDGTHREVPCACEGFRLHPSETIVREAAEDEHLDQESGYGEDEA